MRAKNVSRSDMELQGRIFGVCLGLWLLIGASLAGAWQQRVAYDIAVRLDTVHQFLFGQERLSYWNNSPDTLSFIWIHLYPNAFRDRNTTFGKEMERAGKYGFSFARASDYGYVDMDSVQAAGRNCAYEIHETEMKVDLPRPLAPGDSAFFYFVFRVKIPAIFSRLGHQGQQYVISQWYPKAVVYDAQSWHPDGYHETGEFYGEYGTFDVAITVPVDMAVGATGNLLACNIPGVESWGADSEQAWMKRAPKARTSHRFSIPDKTLRFHAENVHDFCWVADPSFILVQDTFEGQGASGKGRAITINVLAPAERVKEWKDVPAMARHALEFYSRHYGPYVYDQLTVVNAMQPGNGGMEYPNLVVISMAAVPYTRMLEEVVVHEIGHQWFYGMLGSNEMAEAWLDEGINSFAEMRYFEETYGPEGNLLNPAQWPRWLPAFSDRYYQQAEYHLTATNGLLKPVLTPAWKFGDEPIAYAGVIYAEGARIVDMLRQMVGDSVFNDIMRTYYTRFRFRHPTSDDFIRVAEDVSGRDLGWFFSEWLHTTDVCDYALGDIRGTPGLDQRTRDYTVGIRQLGGIRMPVDIAAAFSDGSTQKVTWNSNSKSGEVRFASTARLRSVTLDPDQKLLETNRWNNYFPAKLTIKPVVDMPSFDSYQLFYGPFLWYNSFHGLEIGPWLMGRQFIDAGPVHGNRMWTADVIYNTRSEIFDAGLSYSAPLSFISNELRFGLGGSYSPFTTRGNAGFNWHIGRVFGPPALDLKLGFDYEELDSAHGKHPRDWLDSLDWVKGRVGKLLYSARHDYATRCWRGSEELDLASGTRLVASDSDFWRVDAEIRQTWRPLRDLRFAVRLFGGLAGGSPPPQEQYFLSGSLRPTGAEPITWSYYHDIAATQERWHIEGDANLRGYVTEHVRGRYAAALNLSLPFPYVTPFFDIGNVGDSASVFVPDRLRMDAGLSVALGPLYADFPIWANLPVHGNQLAFRWMVGFRTSGISIGGF